MTEFLRTLNDLLTTGSVTLVLKPTVTDLDRPTSLELLENHFNAARLDVAGPLIGFDGSTALTAAQFTLFAAWYLVNRDTVPAVVVKDLRWPATPLTPEQHLSADLTLCLAAQIYRRAVRIDPADELTKQLEQTLVRWPLSGVLAELPTAPELLDFAHPGLALLYAERFIHHENLPWLPPQLAPPQR